MRYILIALLSAILFGASTPAAKVLLENISPFTLAGLLYLGAALGVLPFSKKKNNALEIKKIGKKNMLYLLGAIVFGGLVGPVLLLFGLDQASASSVSMWLNLELVATALLGFFIFKDHLGKFGWIGVVGTVIASVLLSQYEQSIGIYSLLLIFAACVCWGLDNHLAALIDRITPSQTTFWKGLFAGGTNLIIGLSIESSQLTVLVVVLALMVGIFAYGFSITLYILSAQNLGATRSQMIFASAPFFGVVLSVLLLGESITLITIAAMILLVISLIILFRDQHIHTHSHDMLEHKHLHHHHDKHHNHGHSNDKKVIYHNHWHTHEPVVHRHPHWPDIHHRHKH